MKHKMIYLDYHSGVVLVRQAHVSQVHSKTHTKDSVTSTGFGYSGVRKGEISLELFCMILLPHSS